MPYFECLKCRFLITNNKKRKEAPAAVIDWVASECAKAGTLFPKELANSEGTFYVHDNDGCRMRNRELENQQAEQHAEQQAKRSKLTPPKPDTTGTVSFRHTSVCFQVPSFAHKSDSFVIFQTE